MSVLVGNQDLEFGGLLLHKLFEANLLKHPEWIGKVAVADQSSQLTFGQLNLMSNKLARSILSLTDDDLGLVAIRFEPDVALIATLLAILKSGQAYLPIAPDWPSSRVNYLLADAQPVCVITNIYDQDDIYHKQSTKIVHYKDLLHRSSLAQNGENLEEMGQNDSYAVMYTSGSTGLPKGVRLLHRGAMMRIHWQWHLLPFKSQDDVCAFKAALTFIDAVSEIYSALLSGHKLVVFPREAVTNVSAFVQMLDEFEVSRLFLIPSLMNNMIEHMKLSKTTKLDQLVHWESTGEALTFEVAQAFFDFFPTGRSLANIYGGTEMMDNIYDTFDTMEEFKDKCLDGIKPPLGTPVDNAKVFIMDKDLVTVEPGEVGEICISSPGLASGYIGMPAFATNLYRTGDYGRLVNGRIYYEGRKDSQVKIRGQRLNLSEIEQTLNKSLLDRINKITVLPVFKSNANRMHLVAFTIPRDFEDHKIIKDLIRSSALAPFMVPKLHLVSKYPHLVNGKVDRQKLIGDYQDAVDKVSFEYKDEEFKNEIIEDQYDKARLLLNTVAKVIGSLDKPCLADNFFAIGGTSINSVLAVSQLNESGFEIGINDFIVADSLKDLLDKMMASNEDSRNFVTRPMTMEDKEVTLRMIADSWMTQETLFQSSGFDDQDCLQAAHEIWPLIELQLDLSLVAVDKSSMKVLGVCWGLDTFAPEDKQLEIHLSSSLIQEILEFVTTHEHVQANRLFPASQVPGTAFESFYLATSRDLDPKDNLSVVTALESASLDLAKTRGFKAVMGMNTSPVTQFMAKSNGFTRCETIQINKWISSNGNQTFQPAADDVTVTIDVKYL